MTFFAWDMERAKKEGKLVRIDKVTIKDGMQYPERVLYQHTETGEYTAKLNGEFHHVKGYKGYGGEMQWYF